MATCYFMCDENTSGAINVRLSASRDDKGIWLEEREIPEELLTSLSEEVFTWRIEEYYTEDDDHGDAFRYFDDETLYHDVKPEMAIVADGAFAGAVFTNKANRSLLAVLVGKESTATASEHLSETHDLDKQSTCRLIATGTMTVCGVKYRILGLLGHGKSGYSYLAEAGGHRVVLKQIHHEPCDYYSFGNKIEAELHDYERLMAAGIRIPKMLAIDTETERIVKEYIDGHTIFDYVGVGITVDPYIAQIREMATLAKAAGLNIDYFPTNFVVQDGLIWYVDYECNDYMDEWNFDNWGIKYWSRTPEFEEHLRMLEETKGMTD